MGRFSLPHPHEVRIGSEAWLEYGPGDRVPCPGARDHPGRRVHPRGPDRRQSHSCNRPVYNDVGEGLRILVRVGFAGQSDAAERSPIAPRAGCKIRYCRDCRSWIEIMELPAARRLSS